MKLRQESCTGYRLSQASRPGIVSGPYCKLLSWAQTATFSLAVVFFRKGLLGCLPWYICNWLGVETQASPCLFTWYVSHRPQSSLGHFLESLWGLKSEFAKWHKGGFSPLQHVCVWWKDMVQGPVGAQAAESEPCSKEGKHPCASHLLPATCEQLLC